MKGEGEIEKLQAKVVELRRKVDDTTAAMQELGRENQSLQVSQKALLLLEPYTEETIIKPLFWEALFVTPASGAFLDQTVPKSDQEVGWGPRGAELHVLWEGLQCDCQEGEEEVMSDANMRKDTH